MSPSVLIGWSLWGLVLKGSRWDTINLFHGEDCQRRNINVPDPRGENRPKVRSKRGTGL